MQGANRTLVAGMLSRPSVRGCAARSTTRPWLLLRMLRGLLRLLRGLLCMLLLLLWMLLWMLRGLLRLLRGLLHMLPRMLLLLPRMLRGILRGMLRGLSRMRSWSVPWENSRRRASKEERKCQFDTV